MSTDKFNIHEMGAGNDTHSNFLKRMGYGDLLNRPGRQEITLDTASMYKSAADQGSILGAGIGGVAGGIGGAELAEHMGGSATAKLIGALVGAGIGGVGGYYAGGALDEIDKNTGTSTVDRNRHLIYSGAGSALGALTGYGISKYLVGSKNNTHHVLSALLGAGAGAGAGYLVAGDEEYNKDFADALNVAEQAGMDEDKRNTYARLVAKYKQKVDKSTGITGLYDRLKWKTTDDWIDRMIMQDERDPHDAALREMEGSLDPKEVSPLKAAILSLVSSKASGALYRTATRGTAKRGLKPMGEALKRMVAQDGSFMPYVLNNANIKSLTPAMQKQLWSDMQEAIAKDPNWMTKLSPQEAAKVNLFIKKYYGNGLLSKLMRGVIRPVGRILF